MTSGLVVFAYDFPHKKTQDVVLRLIASGMRPALVVGAPFVPLPHLPLDPLRTKIRHADLLPPAALCDALDIPYAVAPHTVEAIRGVMREHLGATTAELGIVAGARILPEAVIGCFALGVINLHPGLLPDVRGLHALRWAIYHGHPLGVTAHLIDRRVDAGRIVETRRIPEYEDDTLLELELRLYETQLAVLPGAIARVRTAARAPGCDAFVAVGPSRYNRSFPAQLVPALLDRFAVRRAALLESPPLRHVG